VVASVDPKHAAALEILAARHEVPFARLGESGGSVMIVDGAFEQPIARAREIYETAIPALMSRSTPAA
jgi:phosphoribosylformylglycinamidine synthase